MTMDNSANTVRKVSDYNMIFVQLADGEAKIVESISAIGSQAAHIARYQEAAEALERAAATGFVSALA